MRATFNREGLLAAFQVVSSIAPTRTPKTAILQNVKLSVTATEAVLMATDLEAAGIRLKVRGEMTPEEPGDALLPVARFNAILRELPDTEVHLEVDMNGCFVRGASSEFELPGEDPAQYPDVPGFDGDNFHQVQANVLRTLIQRTVFAAAPADSTNRFALGGVLWECSAEKVRLVATDGRRLAVADTIGIMHGQHQTAGQTPVVPSKVMALLERNLTDPEEQIHVCLRPNEALFRTNLAEIYGRLVEGRYPPYKDVFPKKTSFKVQVLAGPFLGAVKQAAILTEEESRAVDFSFGKGKLTLKANVADRGRAKIEMPVDYDGKPLEVKFDPKYVIEMLKVLPEDAVVSLEMGDAATAALFKIGEDYSYIVMPLAREGR
jgi:DNA polymerase-3 subunit beta